jgi:hypothetical protein
MGRRSRNKRRALPDTARIEAALARQRAARGEAPTAPAAPSASGYYRAVAAFPSFFRSSFR